MDADPVDRLGAFLAAHATVEAVPANLYLQGERLHAELCNDPPRDPRWGRFLVAMGHLAAERLGDETAASRYFLAALRGAEHHGDHESAVAAGYDQGVLQERRGSLLHAGAAYKAAAGEGLRLGVAKPVTALAANAAVRVWFQTEGDLDPVHAALAKQAWLLWLLLRARDPAAVDPALDDACGLQLCALLLPEDDPAELPARWRAWAPKRLAVIAPDWHDGHPDCLRELFAAAAAAADRHLADEGGSPGDPYRLLGEALRRTVA